MRAFVAIDIPDRVIDSLVAFQGELSATGGDLKLVERENLHFTVRFLGEIGDPQASEVLSRLGRLRLTKGAVEVRGTGAFPNPRRPRVVWAGVAHEGEGVIGPIAREVIGALEGIGERDERPFQAHITLGRVRSFRNSRELGEFLAGQSERAFGVAELSELKLKSSRLTPSGPVYSDIGVFHLE
ncbi:MAG: RNA 2',3'-cyclic phosphodiesterase [Nitrososphaerota archaeon]|nr:RNA 2',3'-cyclic phosphodiesterase [Nitrososphaerota archaeon]MDG7023642.1 RNA 2',3'-cyclic phosphodiesterase [Nitrososphaerota archaeon]